MMTRAQPNLTAAPMAMAVALATKYSPSYMKNETLLTLPTLKLWMVGAEMVSSSC
jgi:hypothetical protein